MSNQDSGADVQSCQVWLMLHDAIEP